MKAIQLFIALCAATVAAFAEDIALTDGRTLKDAKILSQSPTHVTVKHLEGIAQVSKKVLPEALRTKYPVDEAAAAEMKKKDAILKAQQIADAQRREADAVERRRLRLAAEPRSTRESRTYRVEYCIRGWVPHVDVTMSPPQGTTEQKRIHMRGGDWSQSFDASSGKFLYLSGQLPGSVSGETTFIIKVDGVEVEKATVNGAWVIGTVSHSLP